MGAARARRGGRPADRARVLVVGCAGAIGSHLCEQLVGKGMRVVGVDDMTDRGSAWHHLQVSSAAFFVHECCDAYEGAAAAIALHRPHTVVHLFPADGDRFAHLRSHGLCLDRAVQEGVSTYVYGSDCHVYSAFDGEGPRRRERDALGEPNAARAITHCMGEDMLRLYATRLGAEGGMRGLCARLPPTFGPRSAGERSTAVALVRAVAAGRETRVPDPRNVILDLCPEADVARALAGLLGKRSPPPPSLEVRYLGACRPISLLALLNACERVTGRPALVAAPASDAAAPETIHVQLLRMPHASRRVLRGLPSSLPRSPSPALVAQLELALFATVDGLVGGSHVRSLCCFAAYGETDRLPGNTVQYVRELARSFDRVVVITNEDRGAVRAELPLNAAVWQVPNGGRDFGLHWRMLAPMAEVWGIRGRYAHLDRIALVNDSCRIVRSLQPLFRWAENEALSFWGVSRSSVPVVHLQSYFLVFEGASATGALLDFVRAHDIEQYVHRPVRDIIDVFELGLSQHMAALGFPMAHAAPYTTEGLLALPPPLQGSIQGDNPSHNMWDRMLAVRCPLVKNSRHPVAGDEDFIQHHTALDFLPD